MTDPRFLRRVMPPDVETYLADVAAAIRQDQEAHLRERVAKHLAVRAAERRRRALWIGIAVSGATVVVGVAGGLLLSGLVLVSRGATLVIAAAALLLVAGALVVWTIAMVTGDVDDMVRVALDGGR